MNDPRARQLAKRRQDMAHESGSGLNPPGSNSARRTRPRCYPRPQSGCAPPLRPESHRSPNGPATSTTRSSLTTTARSGANTRPARHRTAMQSSASSGTPRCAPRSGSSKSKASSSGSSAGASRGDHPAARPCFNRSRAAGVCAAPLCHWPSVVNLVVHHWPIASPASRTARGACRVRPPHPRRRVRLRMADLRDPRCNRQLWTAEAGRWACRPCEDRTVTRIAELPALFRQLDTTASLMRGARRPGAGGGGRRRRRFRPAWKSSRWSGRVVSRPDCRRLRMRGGLRSAGRSPRGEAPRPKRCPCWPSS